MASELPEHYVEEAEYMAEQYEAAAEGQDEDE